MLKKVKLFGTKKAAETTNVSKSKNSNPVTKSNAVTCKPKTTKFSAEDEARIQAEVERIKRAKHEQLIEEEIRNRAAGI